MQHRSSHNCFVLDSTERVKISFPTGFFGEKAGFALIPIIGIFRTGFFNLDWSSLQSTQIQIPQLVQEASVTRR
jgi:hypothetical protein